MVKQGDGQPVSFYQRQEARDRRTLTWSEGDRVVTKDGKRTGIIGGIQRVGLSYVQVRVVDVNLYFAFKIESRGLVKVDTQDPESMKLWLSAEEVVGVALKAARIPGSIVDEWFRMVGRQWPE